MAEFKWFGDEVISEVETQMGRRLDKAAAGVSRYAKQHMGRVGLAIGVSRGHKGRFQSRGTTASKPGEFPFKQTGHLRRNVTWEREGLEARWGTNVPYGRELELFNHRPWMSLTNAATQRWVNHVLSEPL